MYLCMNIRSTYVCLYEVYMRLRIYMRACVCMYVYTNVRA